MADETVPVTDPEPTPDEQPTPPTADTAPADDDSQEAPTTVCADGNDEDPELFIGDEIPDPWDDKFQTDWPQNEVTSS